MVPPLSQKWLIFTNLGSGLSQKVGFFLSFEPMLRAGFNNKMLVRSNKIPSSLALFLAFLALVFSQFC